MIQEKNFLLHLALIISYISHQRSKAFGFNSYIAYEQQQTNKWNEMKWNKIKNEKKSKQTYLKF